MLGTKLNNIIFRKKNPDFTNWDRYKICVSVARNILCLMCFDFQALLLFGIWCSCDIFRLLPTRNALYLPNFPLCFLFFLEYNVSFLIILAFFLYFPLSMLYYTKNNVPLLSTPFSLSYIVCCIISRFVGYQSRISGAKGAQVDAVDPPSLCRAHNV
jgi:hypothetical protein